jgi:hypothetical protein
VIRTRFSARLQFHGSRPGDSIPERERSQRRGVDDKRGLNMPVRAFEVAGAQTLARLSKMLLQDTY